MALFFNPARRARLRRDVRRDRMLWAFLRRLAGFLMLLLVASAAVVVRGVEALPGGLGGRDGVSVRGGEVVLTREISSGGTPTGAGDGVPQEINPVTPKFKTVKDPDMPGYPDFGVGAVQSLSSWDDERMVLTTKRFVPGVFQTRLGLGNGYAGATVAAVGPFFERDRNQTNRHGDQPSEGWPMRNPRQTFGTVSGFFDCQATTPETNFEELRARGCESIIAGTPHPLGLHLVVGDQVLNSTVDEKEIEDFDMSMSYQDGVVSWKYTWMPKNESVKFDIEIMSFMHRTRPNVAATQMKVTPRGGSYNARIVDLLDGRSAVRSSLVDKGTRDDLDGIQGFNDTTIWVSNRPEGLPNVTATTVSTIYLPGNVDLRSRRRARSVEEDTGSSMSIGQEWDVNLLDGETAVFYKFVGIASTDKFTGAVALDESLRARDDGWDVLIKEHKDAWNHLMAKDRILNLRDPVTGQLPANEQIKQLQIMHTTSHFYLLQNLLDNSKITGASGPLNDNSISVGGLTSDTYGGMVFWDADFWMFPAILETNPDYAAQIPNYRVKLHPQAQANTQEAYIQAKYKFDDSAALYSWTSGRYGNATGTGPVADYEEHLNAIIAISMFQWLAVTGDEEGFRDRYWGIVESVGHTIGTLMQREGEGWSIRNMTDPDEYANHVDNGAFTLAAFSQVLSQITAYQKQHNMTVNSTWLDMAAHPNIPHDKATGITKEYSTMQNNITVKQADVTMLSYPLLVANYSLANSIRDLRYYSQKQTVDGPAMTNAIAAIAENRVGSSGCAAFTLDTLASLPNLRTPWYQFSEQALDDANANGGTSPAFPFLTGHGGALQIPLYGYLGLDRAKAGVTIRPSLPVPYRHMQLPEFYRAGNRFKASMNNTHTTLTRLPNLFQNGLQDGYPGSKMPIRVERHRDGVLVIEERELDMGETLVVENDMYWQDKSSQGNILQCQPASAQSIEGQFVSAGAAFDGNPVTYWQPENTAFSRLVVDTGDVEGKLVKRIRVEWGKRIPAYARVVFSNSTSDFSTSNISTSNDDSKAQKTINLTPQPNTFCNGTSIPAVEDEMQIQLYQGSCTEVDVIERGIWSAKEVALEVEGCIGCENEDRGEGEMGAMVAEFEVIV